MTAMRNQIANGSDVMWLADATRHLSTCDRVMAGLVERFGVCGLKPREDRFAALVSMIIGQQLGKSAADTIRSRVLELSGGLSPGAILSLDKVDLRRAGLSGAKIEYILSISQGIEAGTLDLNNIPDGDDDAEAVLRSIRGVGRWTAHMFMIFVLCRKDVLPIDDVAIRSAVAELYGVSKTEASEHLVDIAMPWSPYRSAACWYLYAHVNGGTTPEMG